MIIDREGLGNGKLWKRDSAPVVDFNSGISCTEHFLNSEFRVYNEKDFPEILSG